MSMPIYKPEYYAHRTHELVGQLDFILTRAERGMLTELARHPERVHPDSMTAIWLSKAEDRLRELADKCAARRRALIGNERSAA